jgi:hypothetical protein
VLESSVASQLSFESLNWPLVCHGHKVDGATATLGNKASLAVQDLCDATTHSADASETDAEGGHDTCRGVLF